MKLKFLVTINSAVMCPAGVQIDLDGGKTFVAGHRRDSSELVELFQSLFPEQEYTVINPPARLRFDLQGTHSYTLGSILQRLQELGLSYEEVPKFSGVIWLSNSNK